MESPGMVSMLIFLAKPEMFWKNQMQFTIIRLAVFAVLAVPCTAQAQSAPPAATAPGVVTGGSSNVMVGGKPAARQGDATSDGGALVEASPNVFINGKPAVVMGGRTSCGSSTVSGSSNVFINGKPMVRAGDQTSGCAK